MAEGNESGKQPSTVDQEEMDDWDKRIFKTGCAEENSRLTDCYFDKKDWRACRKEMKAFQECWKRNQNDVRTETKDADNGDGK